MCVCFLTPPLSMACRTPCRELREDTPGHVCLKSSRVVRASSRLTSTSNTIPFSSKEIRAHTDRMTHFQKEGFCSEQNINYLALNLFIVLRFLVYFVYL